MDTDELEFQKIYDAFQPRILRYMSRLLGEHEAEDSTQEVFIKVSRSLVDFRGESTLSTWLYRIATHTAIDRMRSLELQSIIPITSPDDLAEQNVVLVEEINVWTREKPLSIEQQLIRDEMNECIRSFIARLPEHYRTVLVLSELEGIRDKEIADILGVTLNTVKIRLHRARKQLKEELETHCEPYWVEDNEFVPDLRRAFAAYREKR